MGSVSIFQLEFSGTRFACSRSFLGGYALEAGDYVMSLTPAVADRVAQGGRFIRWRAQVAARSGREMKAGATFRRNMQAVDGKSVRIELGISDAGDAVYLEIGTARMTLTDVQAQLLLAVLDRLGEDVNTIRRASEQPGMDLTIVQGLRGWLWPWENRPDMVTPAIPRRGIPTISRITVNGKPVVVVVLPKRRPR